MYFGCSGITYTLAFSLPTSLRLLRVAPLVSSASCRRVTLLSKLQSRPASKPPFNSFTHENETAEPLPMPSLPTASQVALGTSMVLSAVALLIPCGLALRDAAASDEGILEHLTDYASHFGVLAATLGFGTLHSGLASLRPWLTPRLGERLYRVGFALTSLPSAVALISFFIAHRYDGAQLFSTSLQSYPATHTLVYVATFVSFLFLYPATFNLLEVAAIQKPTFRIYESGVTRISRHPQLVGQVLWCLAHTAWIGSSFTLVTSLALIAHHCFGAWNGDRRLRDRYGTEWRAYADRTSIIPFAAILSGKQTFHLREFFKPAYIGVIAATMGFYTAHPAMLRAVSQLHW